MKAFRLPFPHAVAFLAMAIAGALPAVETEKRPASPPPASAASSAKRPLAEAAQTLAKQLPKGCIVTAEATGKAPPIIALAGHAPSDTRPDQIIFEIGSVTKVFTGLLLAQAVVEGKTTLDTSITRCLGIKQEFADPSVGEITLKQLATHTSGLPRLPANLQEGADPADPYAHFDRDKLCAALKTVKLPKDGSFPMDYSNLGVGLLGEVLACLYDKPWAELVQEKITGPLGMKNTVVELSRDQKKRFAPPHDGKKTVKPWKLNALSGAGALRSNAHDMLIFGKAILHPQDTPLHQAINLLKEPQTKDGSIGLGLFIGKLDGEPFFEHNGGTGGYRSTLRLHPKRDLVQVVLINNSQLDSGSIFIATRQEKARQHDSAVHLTDPELQAYTGIYREEGSSAFTIVLKGNQLMARLTGQTFIPIFPHEESDRFFYKKVPAELQFRRGDSDPKDKAAARPIVSLTLIQNGQESTYPKTVAPTPKILLKSGKELQPYVGTYSLLLGVKFELKVVDDTLFAKLADQPFLPIFETRDNWFEYDGIKAALLFERDESGAITALSLHQNGLVQRAIKKPSPKGE